MSELSEAMQQFIDGLVEELKANVPSVSGKTASLIEGTVTEESGTGFQNVKGEITGPIQLVVKETGRGPTKTTVAGSPTLQQIILQWIKAKNIIPQGKMTQEQLSWAISTKIHRDGDKLYSDPPSGYKKSGVISDVINDERIDAFLGAFTEKATTILIKSFVDKLKK